jgi:hypothetical protein
MFQGEPVMNNAKSTAKANKSPPRKPKSLKVSTNVKAGGIRMQNRCEILQRQV